jgi:hypothetical protein
MPDRTYTLNYTANNADVLAKTGQVMAELKALEAQADRVRDKLKTIFTGVAPGAGAAARSVQGLGNQLGAVSTKAGAAQDALSGMGTSAAAVPAAVKPATASVGQFAGAMVGLHVGQQALHAVLEVSKEIEDRWKKMAEEAVVFRDSLRELSNIKGEEGPGNKTYAEVLKLSLETDTTAEKAREAAQSYENIGPTVRQKGHYKPGPGQGTPADLEQNVLIEAIRTGRRYGLDEGAAGEAVGQVGMFHEIASPESAMTQMGMAMKGLSEGKLSYTKGIVALNKASAKLVDPREAGAEGARPGRIGSYGEAGIYLGAMSLGTGTADQAQHRMVQISRALNPTDEGKRANLAAAGITDAMDDPRRLIQLSKYMKEQKVADPNKWLAERNIGSEATREAIVAGMKVSDVLETRLAAGAAGRKDNATGKETIAANARFRQRQQGSVNAQARVAKDVMDKVEGEQAESLETAKAFAEERMRQRDPHYRSIWRAPILAATSLPTYLMAGVGGAGYHAEQQETMGAIPTLRREAARVGVDVDKQFPGIASGDYVSRAKAFGEAARAVQDKGGDPYGRAGVMKGARERVDRIPGQGGAAAAPAAGSGVPVTSAGPGGDRVQLEQLAVLKGIRDAVSGGGGGNAPGPMVSIGPAPLPGGPMRIGES